MMSDFNPAIKKFFEDQGLIVRLREPYHLGNHSVNYYWEVELVKLSYWVLVAAYYVNTHNILYRIGLDRHSKWYSEKEALRIINLKAFS